MSEVKDPGIKLFGKTIALLDISAADCGGACLAPSSDPAGRDGPTQDHPSSSNSSPEEDDLTRAGEEQEPEKVWVGLVVFNSK